MRVSPTSVKTSQFPSFKMSKVVFVLLILATNAISDEHLSERQKIANRMREGFLMISLKDMLVLPRLLKRR